MLYQIKRTIHVKICITCCINPRQILAIRSPVLWPILFPRVDTARDTDFAIYYSLYNDILVHYQLLCCFVFHPYRWRSYYKMWSLWIPLTRLTHLIYVTFPTQDVEFDQHMSWAFSCSVIWEDMCFVCLLILTELLTNTA